MNAVTSKVSLETISYANESAALDAIDQSKVYGAYIPGTKSDTLIVIPAKSFFGRVELEGRSPTPPRSSATRGRTDGQTDDGSAPHRGLPDSKSSWEPPEHS